VEKTPSQPKGSYRRSRPIAKMPKMFKYRH
jgi:hypothetical protein